MRRGKLKLKRGAAGADGASAASDDLACVNCGADLDGMDAHARVAHVNGCLSPPPAATASRCACAVCGRDLSEYSESARLHHANRCCDSLRPAAAPAPPAGPSASPSSASSAAAPASHCVVCGCAFQSIFRPILGLFSAYKNGLRAGRTSRS